MEGIFSIPDDVLTQHCLSRLEFRDLIAFAATCRKARALVDQDVLWRPFISGFRYPRDPHEPTTNLRGRLTHMSRLVMDLKHVLQAGKLGLRCNYRGSSTADIKSVVIPHSPYLLCSNQNLILVYDCQQKKVVQTLRGHGCDVSDIKLAYLGKKPVAVTLDGSEKQLMFWDCETWTRMGTLSGDFDGSYGLKGDETSIDVVWITGKNALMWLKWDPSQQVDPKEVIATFIPTDIQTELRSIGKLQFFIQNDHPDGWVVTYMIVIDGNQYFSYARIIAGVLNLKELVNGPVRLESVDNPVPDHRTLWFTEYAETVSGKQFWANSVGHPPPYRADTVQKVKLWSGHDKLATVGLLQRPDLGFYVEVDSIDCLWCNVRGVPHALFPFVEGKMVLWDLEQKKEKLTFSCSGTLRGCPLIVESADETLLIALTCTNGLFAWSLVTGETVAELDTSQKWRGTRACRLHAIDFGGRLNLVGIGWDDFTYGIGPWIHSLAEVGQGEKPIRTVNEAAMERRRDHAIRIALALLVVLGAYRLWKRYGPALSFRRA